MRLSYDSSTYHYNASFSLATGFCSPIAEYCRVLISWFSFLILFGKGTTLSNHRVNSGSSGESIPVRSDSSMRSNWVSRVLAKPSPRMAPSKTWSRAYRGISYSYSRSSPSHLSRNSVLLLWYCARYSTPAVVVRRSSLSKISLLDLHFGSLRNYSTSSA